MSSSTRVVVAIALAAIVSAAVPPAADAQSIEAEALFQEGRRLLKAGKFAEACDKLDASERLESAIGTMFNLADCREKNGQLATAWAVFLKAAAASGRASNDGKREAEARRRAKALEARLAYLTVSVPAASVVDGLEVLRNGAPVDPGLWNQGIPVDAGSYEITGQAPGHEPWSTRVTIDSEGQRASVEVPRFKRLEELVAEPVAPPAPVVVTDDDEDERVRATPGRFTTTRKLALGVGVVGLAAIGGGVAFGLKARDLQDQANVLCSAATCSDTESVRLNGEARDQALRSNLLFGVGGVAVVGAVVLWLVGAPDAITPVVDDDHVGLAYAGSF